MVRISPDCERSSAWADSRREMVEQRRGSRIVGDVDWTWTIKSVMCWWNSGVHVLPTTSRRPDFAPPPSSSGRRSSVVARTICSMACGSSRMFDVMPSRDLFLWTERPKHSAFVAFMSALASCLASWTIPARPKGAPPRTPSRSVSWYRSLTTSDSAAIFM